MEQTDLQFIEERLDLVFGNDCWDIAGIANHKTCYVHFPEIEIENSEEEIHNIKDLYVKFSFQVMDGKVEGFSNSLEGLRATVTAEEFYKGYRHSHLYVSDGASDNEELVDMDEDQLFEAFETYFQSFCLGSHTMEKVLNTLTLDFTKEGFAIFLNQLDSFVRWESKEGGPYIRMKKIPKIAGKYVRLSDPIDTIHPTQALLDSIFNHLTLEDLKELDINVYDDLVVVEDAVSLKLLEESSHLFSKAFKYEGDYYVKIESSDPKFVEDFYNQNHTYFNENTPLRFRDKEVFTKVEAPNLQLDEEGQKIQEEGIEVLDPRHVKGFIIALNDITYNYYNKPKKTTWKLPTPEGHY